jgi:hypothetical protein
MLVQSICNCLLHLCNVRVLYILVKRFSQSVFQFANTDSFAQVVGGSRFITWNTVVLVTSQECKVIQLELLDPEECFFLENTLINL